MNTQVVPPSEDLEPRRVELLQERRWLRRFTWALPVAAVAGLVVTWWASGSFFYGMMCFFGVGFAGLFLFLFPAASGEQKRNESRRTHPQHLEDALSYRQVVTVRKGAAVAALTYSNMRDDDAKRIAASCYRLTEAAEEVAGLLEQRRPLVKRFLDPRDVKQ
ncbi:MAG TPA: hypothetical protein VK963_00515 [Candidatus Saccharimonadales bacterium]|nr:hypothetical protein [Candidatus Saccharimonadales bacterium]